MGQRLGVTEDFLATGHERHEESARLVEAELALRLDELDLAAQLYERRSKVQRATSGRARLQVSARSRSSAVTPGKRSSASRRHGRQRGSGLPTSRPPQTPSAAPTQWSTS